MRLRVLHRASASIIGLFAIVHVANHVASLLGAATALLIVLSLAGRLQPVEIPDHYTAPYRQMLSSFSSGGAA